MVADIERPPLFKISGSTPDMVVFQSTREFQIFRESKDNLKYLFLKTGVVKYFNYSQIAANKSKLFDFDTPKFKKYFEEL